MTTQTEKHSHKLVPNDDEITVANGIVYGLDCEVCGESAGALQISPEELISAAVLRSGNAGHITVDWA